MQCDFCSSTENNPAKLGPFMRTTRVTAHYYCVLLSFDLPQRGNDRQGILGFLQKDIMSTIKIRKTKRCHYCKTMGAACKCKVCPKFFHLPCVLKAGGCPLFQPYFATKCHKHYVKPKTVKGTDYNWCCVICLDKITPKVVRTGDIMIPPCCKKHLMHKLCVEKLVENSAYYTRCPMCQDSDLFQNYLAQHGVFIAHRESTWNNENIIPAPMGNVFTHCNAKPCICPRGRFYIVLNHRQHDLLICYYCGSDAVHVMCTNSEKFVCPTCLDMLENKRVDPPPIEGPPQIVERPQMERIDRDSSIDRSPQLERIDGNPRDERCKSPPQLGNYIQTENPPQTENTPPDSDNDSSPLLKIPSRRQSRYGRTYRFLQEITDNTKNS